MTSTGTTDKPFRIEKRQVYEAYKAVKANRGAARVDGETLEMFDKELARNLYKIWNRMSSGTYFPPPVRAVSIPKKAGGERVLGVPTVSDRIAQMVVKQMIEPDLDSLFLPDSYGYRPGKSALDAVGVVIPPFLTGLRSRIHAAIFSFCAGVMPPMPILGRSLLYVHSHCVANSCASSMLSMMYWSSHSCRTVRL